MWTDLFESVCSSVRQGILAYGRTKGYFYAYYITKTLTGMLCEGSMMCLSLAYVVSISARPCLKLTRQVCLN